MGSGSSGLGFLFLARTRTNRTLVHTRTHILGLINGRRFFHNFCALLRGRRAKK
uniref:Uncharacterized protein n=1 Tax=Candidatus Kentrum sp. FM TaxID=2126340 RepID=A0A450TQG3_9GAMM|nr:MAG: hypothetical protein BECKFM1743A_GA0114220_105371 [Candidatus Kentron sp. FM]VFK18005.1 MAG: hypothetical protein BECKFM1743B_GA0114221_105191 [Candidatus Kentron sp. FM]